MIEKKCLYHGISFHSSDHFRMDIAPKWKVQITYTEIQNFLGDAVAGVFMISTRLTEPFLDFIVFNVLATCTRLFKALF